ncbi:protein of unknown function (plasmid) [Pararobbsia alpina]|uniref:response regulator transcription factor n=1 Tax=Pararobbsia alpina TaxID=621374 RepID=UPI0039A506A8
MPQRFLSGEQWNRGRQAAHVPVRVLAVDDNRDTLEVISIVLTLHGYAVSTALDGASAIRSAALAQPDVVLLDITLPDMSGVDVLRALRSRGVTCPAVAWTAVSFDSDKLAYRKAGFDAFCGKPGDMDLLVRILLALTQPDGAPSVADR